MPELIVKLGDKLVQRYVFDKDVISIGRARDNDIVIENLSVSRNHARIRRADGKFILTDLNSANGTMVNMVRVTKHEIVDGDLVQIGKHSLQFNGKETTNFPDIPPAEAPAAPPLSGMASVGASAGMASVGTGSMASSSPGAAGTSEGDLPNPGMVVVVKGKQSDQRFRVARRETTIGRANDNDVRLHDWFVSKKHAQIVRRDGGFFLRDLQSWRGTTVNGQNVRAEVQLREGDEVTLGTTVLRFSESIPKELEAEMAAQAAVAAKARMLADEDAIAGDDLPPPDYATKNIEPPSKDDRPVVVMGDIGTYRAPVDDNPPTNPATGPSKQSSGSRTAVPVGREVPKDPASAEDDFSPMSEEELSAMEAEADASVPADQVDALVRAEWENFELEGMASMGERFDDARSDAAKEEEKAVRPPTESLFDQTGGGFTHEELNAEERGLFGGPMDAEPAKAPASAKPTAPPPVALKAAPARTMTASDTPLPIAEMDDAERQRQIQIWTRATQNKSDLIREYAAKELKKLTGQEND
jgi:pSer/pThr/pTyr-binding forkhead associated (FHA) protein